MSRGCKLRVLDVVHTRDVPLYLIRGPPLPIVTAEMATKNFLSQTIFGRDPEPPQDDGQSLPLWQRQLQQLEYGILLKVNHGTNSSSTAVTELLIYAAIDRNGFTAFTTISAPQSSWLSIYESALTNTQPSLDKFDVKLYALPLDSRRLDHLLVTRVGTSAGSATLGEGEAQFLPLDRINSELQQPPRKRRILSDVLDEASYQRKKLKGRGGEGVSRSMMSWQLIGNPIYSVSQQEKPVSGQQSLNDQPVDTFIRNLSRVSRTNSLLGLDSSRSPSKKKAVIPGQNTGDTDNGFSGQNKSTLARLVKAGMRVHGLEQPKTPGSNKPSPFSTNLAAISTIQKATNTKTRASDPDPDSGEYKAIYHQTFKAASFTFRTQFSHHLIAQEPMREVVDRLLSLFCTNPELSSNTAKAAATSAFGSQEEASQAVFDPPSSSNVGPAVTITRAEAPRNHGRPWDQ